MNKINLLKKKNVQEEDEPRKQTEEHTLEAWNGKEKQAGLVKGLDIRSQKSFHSFKHRKTVLPLTEEELVWEENISAHIFKFTSASRV